MGRSQSLLSAAFFCEHCQNNTRFLPIHFACAVTGVSRRTIYYWMERDWVHWRELPSGRRVICQESLSHPARNPVHPVLPQTISAKLRKTVQSRKLTRR